MKRLMRTQRHWQACLPLAGCLTWLTAQWCGAAVVISNEPEAWSSGAALTNALHVTLDASPSPGDVTWDVHSAWRGRLNGAGSVSSNILEFIPENPFLPGEPVAAAVMTPDMPRAHAWTFCAGTAGGSGIFSTNAQTLALDTGGFAVSGIALRMLSAADMNGDDAVDLLVPYWNTNRVAWLQNDLVGGVTLAMLNAPAGRRLLDVTVADLSTNATRDMLLGARDGVLLAGYGNGNGSVTNWDNILPGGTAHYRAVAQGDIDGDGWPDLVALAEDVGAGAALQVALNSNGVLVTNTTIALGGSAYGLALGDINGDGFFDAVVSGSSGFVGAYTNNGQTLVAACETSVDSRHLYACCLLDAKGDGRAEIAVAGAEGFFALGKLEWDSLVFEELEQSAADDTLYGLTAGDLNGDGHSDLVAAGGSQVLTLMNDGSGSFHPQLAATLPGESLRDAVLLDGDGDSMLDVAVCGFLSGRVYLLWNPDIPVYHGLLENQTAVDTTAFDYVFPADTFSSHIAGVLSYELSAADGSPAPAWLSLDSSMRQIESPSAQMGIYELTVIARDVDGRERRVDWTLSVVPGLTVTSEGQGAVNPTGLVPVAYGAGATFTLLPAEYWSVDEIRTNGVPMECSELEFTWMDVTANGTFHAIFAPDLAAQGTPHHWLTEHGLTGGGTYTFDQAEQRVMGPHNFTAAQEYIADTDPNDPDDYFHITQFSKGPPFTLHFQSSSNRLYTLMDSTNLSTETWQPVHGAGPRAGSGGVDIMTDTNDPPKGPFYRLKVKLP